MITGMLEGTDLIIVLVIILVLFGSAKLPKLARSLGEAKRELDKGMKGDDATTTTMSATPAPAPPPAVTATAPAPPAPPVVTPPPVAAPVENQPPTDQVG
jgi:sec-independent protein translocase protein TatA